MNSISPTIFLALAFGFTLAVRVAILIILRSGETTRTPNIDHSKPTIINNAKFDNCRTQTKQ